MSESTKLPTEFADLQAFADRFAASDDLVRQSKIESASPDELRNLVGALWSRFGAINAYLDGHDDDAAHLLGRLAEAASEAAIEIGPPKPL